MSAILPLLMFVLFAACVGVLYPEGIWGNAITLINVVTAALVATSCYEPLSRFFEGNLDESFAFFWDFLSVWALFGGLVIIMRLITDRLSRTKVRFLKLADHIGSGVLAALVGWVFVCFTMMTLHMAPLCRNFCFEGFVPEERMVVGLAPDRQWLAFTQLVSRGSLSRTLAPDEVKSYNAGSGSTEEKLAVFDARGEFMLKYATIRDHLETYAKTRNAFRVEASDKMTMPVRSTK